MSDEPARSGNISDGGVGVELETAFEYWRWKCPECGEEKIQDGRSDHYCVCGEGRVARKSDEWEKLETVWRSDAEQYAEDMAEKACKIAVRDTLKEVLDLIDKRIEEAENTIGEIRKCEADSCPHDMDELEHKEDEIMAVANKLSLKELRGDLENEVEKE